MKKLLSVIFAILSIFDAIAKSTNNVIEYTSTDGNIVTPYSPDAFGANIVSNTYKNGQGMLIFDSEITSIGDRAFYECSSLSSINLPDCITKIGDDAFLWCTNLSEVSIPENVSNIGEYAFCRCNLGSIYLPKNVESIGMASFSYNPNLSSIAVASDNSKYDSRNGCNAIVETETNKLIQGCNNSQIPNNVEIIGSRAFSGVNITSIDIPNSVIEIGRYAFQGAKLTSLTIPGSVQLLDFFIAQNNPDLKDVYVFWNIPSFFAFDVIATKEEENLMTLHVPYGTKSKYEAKGSGWEYFGNIVEMDPEFIEIADGTVYTRQEDVTTFVKYTRSFESTAWQSLYVPFSIPVEKLKEFGLTVAELNDTHQWDRDGDGIADSTRIEFFTLTSGSTQANYPYLIKADLAFDLTLELDGVELKAAEENSYDCSSMKQMFTFVGTHSGVNGTEMYDNNYYAMAGGGLKRSSSAAVGLKPQRWYLKIENRNGSPVQYFAPSIRFSIDGIDEEPEATGLGSIICGNGDGQIYSLDGLRQDPSRLTKGVYVQNGKKVIVR